MPLFARKADRPARPSDRPPRPPAAGRGGAGRPTKQSPLVQDVHVSPFLADHTRAGLADRFNELRERRTDSVLVSVCLAVCLLVSLGVNAFQASRSHIEPYLVVVDGSEGYLLEHGALEPMDGIEDLYLQREMREVVSGLRTVTNDRAATAASFNRAYKKVVQGSPGDAFLDDFFLRQGNHPLDLVGRGQRTVVEFTGPAHVAGTRTWTVQWIERTAMGGTGVTEDLYRGSLTVDVLPVEDLATAEANPLGVWIDGLQWERVSSKYLDLEELGNVTPMEYLYPDPSRRSGSAGFDAAPAAAPPAPAPGAAATPPTTGPAPTGPAAGPE